MRELPENLGLDRETTFDNTVYRVLQEMDNDFLLVTTKDDYDNQNFPIQTYLIPNSGINNYGKI